MQARFERYRSSRHTIDGQFCINQTRSQYMTKVPEETTFAEPRERSANKRECARKRAWHINFVLKEENKF